MTRRGYYMIKYRTDLATFEMKIDFLRYGLIEFVWHTLILLLPFLPLLIVAASVSAVSFTIFIAAMSILYAVSLLCRMFGFVVYLFWGRMSTLGYIVARAAKAGAGQAINLDRCTYDDAELFFSYRRTTHRGEPDYGRMLSAIVMDRD